MSLAFHQYDFPEGTILIYHTGEVGYIRAPSSTFSGAITKPYTVCDNLGGCSQGKVTFNVHPKDGAENAGEASCKVKVGKKMPEAVGKPINVTNGNMYVTQTDYKQFGEWCGIFRAWLGDRF